MPSGAQTSVADPLSVEAGTVLVAEAERDGFTEFLFDGRHGLFADEPVHQGLACKTAALCLDLSSIAKGFGVDELARVMDAFAIPAWLVGIDGEMRAKVMKPDGEPWAVAHERPDRSVREPMGVIELHDMAIATSGNYRHWIETDGRIVSHTMNAATSAPLDNAVASVTVVAPTCMEADAFATAFMVLGVEESMRIAKARGIEVIFVLNNGSVVMAEAPD